MHNITIKRCLSYEHTKAAFYFVTVGCQHFFFLSEEALQAELKAYMRNPSVASDLYYQFQHEVELTKTEREAANAEAMSSPIARKDNAKKSTNINLRPSFISGERTKTDDRD
jgi:hypothetical protein